MSEDNRAYYARRAQAERESAEKSPDPAIAKLHLDMATRYDDIASGAADASLKISR